MEHKLWTKILTNESLVVDDSLGLSQISIILISGAGTFTGTLKAGTFNSESLPLIVQNPVTSPIAPMVIDCSGGGVIHVLGYR